MSLIHIVLLVIQVVSALSIIVLVLLQQGKGADMGSSFGSGSAGSLFGATGAANFLSRTTKWSAVVFFAATLGLAWLSHHGASSIVDSGVMSGYSAPTPAPATGSAVPGSSSGSVASGTGTTPATPSVPGAATDSAVPGAAPAAPSAQGQNGAASQNSVPSTPSTKQ